MDPNKLLFVAKKAMERAYAPYSNYKVGAALVCDDGTVFKGCNIENASYGLTNCAERTAVFSAIAAGKRKFKAIAIAASGEATPFPCGACRQALAEFCGPDFSVYVASGADTYETTTLDVLLPHRFDFRGSDD
jgi:cytidine deaminase